MRQFLWGLITLLLCANLAYSQHYRYNMGGSSTADTLVSTTRDTTGVFNLWASDNIRRPGDPCFFFALQNIGTANTLHDSLSIHLYVTNTPNISKADYRWCFVDSFQVASLPCGTLTDDESFYLPADSMAVMKGISFRYARMILYFISAADASADSTLYHIQYTGDRGAGQ